MERADIAIIGAGPGGISAAITATLRQKKILLFGTKDLSAKMRKAHRIDNYPGLPAITGEGLADAMQAHLDSMGIQVTEDRITQVYAMGDYFALQGREMYEAETVILAGGVAPGKLLEGEADLVGRGVSYCATCDAALYRGKDTIVVGYSAREEEEANFLADVASSVIYVPVYNGETHLDKRVTVLKERPVAVRGTLRKRILVTDQGEHETDGLFILRDSVSPGQLVPGLEMDGPHVKVDLKMASNLPGLFACGDIAGKPYQYIKAAGQGNTAALSAVEYIASRHADK